MGSKWMYRDWIDSSRRRSVRLLGSVMCALIVAGVVAIDPAETEAFVSEICPVIEDYFDRRGFSLEGGAREPGFR